MQQRKNLMPCWAQRMTIIAGIISLLVALPWEKQLDHKFHWDKTPVDGTGEQDKPTFTRAVTKISSHGSLLEAWVYLPKHNANSTSGSSLPPVLIMAHGMGAQKDIGLWMYAEKFVAAGMAVVLFDYRCFGGSEGLPRHWVSPRRHLQDWEAVVRHVQKTNLAGAVDGSRIALWGVSYSGGHVLVTAAKFGDRVKAVVANEPYVSPTAVLSTASLRGVNRSLRLLAVGISDELRRIFSKTTGIHLAPIYLRLVAPMADPNALALLPLQESEMAIPNVRAPPKRQGGWQNKVLARVVLEALGYNPSKHFRKITAPVWFRVALQDHLCPSSVVLAAIRGSGLPDSQYTVQERNVTHLEAHSSGVKEGEIRPVIAFLRSHLGLGGGDAGAGAGHEELSIQEGEKLAETQFPETS